MINDNKKLQKLEKEFNILLEPIFRVLPVHSELCTALEARLDKGEDIVGEVLKDKVPLASLCPLSTDSPWYSLTPFLYNLCCLTPALINPNLF